MGRHKKKVTDIVKDNSKSSSLESMINNEFGNGIVTNGNYILNQKNVVIPVSPSIDIILGGILSGSFFTLTGHPKCGKTVTSLDFASTAQQLKYSEECCPKGRKIYYYSLEGRLKTRDLIGIPHLNKDRFYIIQSVPGKILVGSDYLEIAERFINEEPGSVHIIDSYSSLCTSLEKLGTMSDQQRADGPKLISKFCRKVCNVVPVNKCIVIGITHLMGNPGYGSEFKEKSGQSIAYAVDEKLRCVKFEPWLNPSNIQVGQTVEWLAQATSRYICPGGKSISFIRYGKGIDKTRELLNIAVDLNLVKRGGAWYEFPLFNNQKSQGLDSSVQLIENIDNGYDKLYDKIKEMLNLKI